ncbi:hypothetical protein PQO03_10945 [Lentisphaera profundi]|uniref:NAD(P)-binding domain-containing protein n=1 Tax=Lentisphaera profundi TaxID=1658616 RepID=A0ABY7VSE1_9BACT|nr:hypothetical protein [Lentisphaera profundi]WDE96224.1 hypothetical protein PQO03_10945 [Lentisphaera profundi]
MRAIIFGATGATGQELAQILCKDDLWTEIYCPSRRPLTWTDSKLKVIDFNKALESFDIDCDAVFICIGTTVKQAGSEQAFRKVDFDLVLDICKWAQNKKIPEIHIQSSQGADSHSKMNYLKVKGDLEDAVQELNFERVIIYRPALLCGAHRKDFRIAEELGYLVLKVLVAIFPPLKKQLPVEVNAVARCMADRENLKSSLEIINSPEIAEYGMPPKRFLSENSVIFKLLLIIFTFVVVLSQRINHDKLEQVLYAFLTALVMQILILSYNKLSLSKKIISSKIWKKVISF